jgi:hypothetical protein
MTSDATRRSGDTLVVFEGSKRITWGQSSHDRWTLRELWPDAAQNTEVRRRIAYGQPLLVILDEPDPVVSLLPEELLGAPPAVAALADEPVGELVRLRVPTLNWLPDNLRLRGQRFLATSMEQTTGIPKALLPALVFDEPDAATPHVRFAWRLNTRVRLDHDIDAIVEHCFGGVRHCLWACAGAEAV